MRPFVRILPALLAALVGQPAASQTNPWVAACEARVNPKPADYSWATGDFDESNIRELEESRLVTVTRDRHRAIALLARRPFIRLTSSQVKAFARPVSRGSAAAGLRPYLIRAIAAGPDDPTITAHWDGHSLYLIGTAMGACPEVVKTPVIILLERPPTKVFIGTAGAL